MTNALDQNIEKYANVAGPDTFVRLLTLAGMFPEQMKRWIPHALVSWKENFDRILWFDVYLIISSAKR